MDPAWEHRYVQGYGTDCPSEDVAMFLANLEPGNVLDVGCGTGANLLYAAQHGWNPTGIDGSEAAVVAANHRLRRGGFYGIDLVTKYILPDYPLLFEDNTFQAALDIECVYALPYSEACCVYNEIHRILAPGGKLLVKAFTDETWKGKEVIKDARFSSPIEMRALLSKFTITRFYELQRLYAAGVVCEWVIWAEK